MRAAESWVRTRLGGAPERLIDEMVSALPATALSDAEALAEGALALYARVLSGTGGREDALPLLAADALLTHAHAACAETDPAGLDAFAARWGGAGRLAEVIG